MESRSAVIVGTGMSVPSRVVTNHDLEKLVDTSDEWIATRTGIRERRIAVEGEVVSQFAIEASRNALEAARISAEDLDLILCATVTPDAPIPATSCLIQHALGAKRAAAFDMQAGCSGFIYAQSVAKQFILTGRCRHVLVIGAELLSKFLDWSDRTTCVIFADGAGAVVMASGEPPRGVLASAMHTDGSMSDFIVLEGGGCKLPHRGYGGKGPPLHPDARQRDVQDRGAESRGSLEGGPARGRPRARAIILPGLIGAAQPYLFNQGRFQADSLNQSF